jgi:hypothetical protein
MQTIETLNTQMAGAGFQLEKVFEGVEESHADFLAHPAMMTPRQVAVHLADCYVAMQKKARSEEPEWGSYQAPGSSLKDALAGMKAEREKAMGSISILDEKEQIHLATDFLILHDAYHVGQMCTIRLAIDPEWNYHSIYG